MLTPLFLYMTYHLYINGVVFPNPGGRVYLRYRIIVPNKHDTGTVCPPIPANIQGENEAEYEALIQGLTDLIQRIEAAGKDPKDYRVSVYTKRIVIYNQVLGNTASNKLSPWLLRVQPLYARFGNFSIEWMDKEALHGYLFAPIGVKK